MLVLVHVYEKVGEQRRFAGLLTSVLIGFLGVLSRALSLSVAASTLGVKSFVESCVGSTALGLI